jgi:hypothetical protein
MVLKHILGLALATLLLAAPVRAADVDPYLPADTEGVVSINLRQILGSALVKQVGGVDIIRNALRSQEEVNALLKELMFDPLKDVDRITIAGPSSGETDKGLVIIRGRFNVEKFRARAEKAAKNNKDQLKVRKVKDPRGGEHTVYEFNVVPPQGGAAQTIFAGIPSKNILLAAPSLDYLVDAMRVKPDATKITLKNKAFATLLTRLDDKQSVSFTSVMTEAALKQIPAEIPAADLLKKLTAISGGITLTDGFKLEVMAATKQAADAKALGAKINEGLNAALILVGIAAMNEPKLAPVMDLVKSLKTSVKDTTVTVKGEVSGEMLQKLIPKN